MTRQKKELIRKIDEIIAFIEADNELGCRFAPTGFFTPLEKEIWKLEEELAKLMHYPDAMAMMMDSRGVVYDPEIPFL